MRAGPRQRVLAIVLLLALVPCVAIAADLPGWDRTRWGMTSREVAALYGKEATTLSEGLDFGPFYSDVVLRHAPYAGHDYTVYFQMGDMTRRLAQVLLERRRQYATPDAWRDALATLERDFGPPTRNCDNPGNPAQGVPAVLERVWVLPTTTVHASFLNFGGEPSFYESLSVSRRILLRFAPTGKSPAACP